MKRVLVVAGALLLSIGAVVAQQDVANQTQTTMKANRQGPWGRFSLRW